MEWRGARYRLVVSFRDMGETKAGGISYRGPLRTVRGDHYGTSLTTFLSHWPTASVGFLSARIGAVTFIFSAAQNLIGVDLGVTPLP
jgi:hypothetical protein